ncbi:hypothetical protein EHM76_01620 [bacterium]|nr:MAG: hypothetical protein EHM76_01620 [bacterium]
MRTGKFRYVVSNLPDVWSTEISEIKPGEKAMNEEDERYLGYLVIMIICVIGLLVLYDPTNWIK